MAYYTTIGNGHFGDGGEGVILEMAILVMGKRGVIANQKKGKKNS